MNLLTAAALAAVIAFATPAVAAPGAGEPAPAFSATTADGKTLTLDELKGKIVVLEWTNAECPFVLKHYDSGNMQALQKEITAKDVVWLQVISSAEGKQGHVDGAKAQKLNAERNAAPTNTLLDPTGVIGRAYGAQTTPHMFVIDADGKLAYKGAIDDNSSTNPETAKTANNFVRAAVNELLAGKPVTKPSVKSYGCGIKYAS